MRVNAAECACPWSVPLWFKILLRVINKLTQEGFEPMCIQPHIGSAVFWASRRGAALILCHSRSLRHLHCRNIFFKRFKKNQFYSNYLTWRPKWIDLNEYVTNSFKNASHKIKTLYHRAIAQEGFELTMIPISIIRVDPSCIQWMRKNIFHVSTGLLYMAQAGFEPNFDT